jgi:hypothetical protein
MRIFASARVCRDRQEGTIPWSVMGEPEQLVQFLISGSLEFGIGGAIASDAARVRSILTRCAPAEGGLLTGPCRACTWIESNSAATSATNTIAEGNILLTERYAPCARTGLVHLLAARTWFNINLIIHVSGPVWEHDKKLAFLLSLLIRCRRPLRFDPFVCTTRSLPAPIHLPPAHSPAAAQFKSHSLSETLRQSSRPSPRPRATRTTLPSISRHPVALPSAAPRSLLLFSLLSSAQSMV